MSKPLATKVSTPPGPSLVNGGFDYRVPRLRAPPPRRSQSKKTLRTVNGQHLQVFLSLANLNIQKSLRHSNTRRGKAQVCTCAMFGAHAESRVSQTARPNRALLHLNKQISLNMQTEKDVSPIQHQRGVLCAQGPCGETRLKACEHRICLFLLLYQQVHTKLMYIRKHLLNDLKVKVQKNL